jgi:hypothetical protein
MVVLQKSIPDIRFITKQIPDEIGIANTPSEVQGLATRHIKVGMGFQGIDLDFQLSWVQLVVVIQKLNVFACRRTNAKLARGTKATIDVHSKELNASIDRHVAHHRRFNRWIRRDVIANQYLKVLIALLLDALNRLAQKGRAIKRRYDDADFSFLDDCLQQFGRRIA